MTITKCPPYRMESSLTTKSFESNVLSHPDMVFFSEPADGKFQIMNRRLDVFEISEAEVANHEWAQLEKVLLCQRRPDNMHHLARIVGYYSMTHSWNRSKLAELRDRQNGDYEVN